MRPPRVSVVLYVHNARPYLPEMLASIEAQVFRDFEVVFVDDGSTDGTREALEAFQPTGVKVIGRSQPANGRDRLHETVNAGVRLTMADYIAFANGDDIWDPGKLARQVAVLDARPEIDMVTHDATFIDAAGADIPGGWGTPDEATRPYYERGLLARFMFAANCLPNPSVMFRRSVWDDVGPQRVGWMHDYEWLFRCALARVRVCPLPEKLMRYRVHEGSHSTSRARLDRIIEEARKVRWRMFNGHSIGGIYPEIACAFSRGEEEAAAAAANRHLALVMASGGHHELAECALMRSLETDPGNVMALNNLAVASAHADAEGRRAALDTLRRLPGNVLSQEPFASNLAALTRRVEADARGEECPIRLQSVASASDEALLARLRGILEE